MIGRIHLLCMALVLSAGAFARPSIAALVPVRLTQQGRLFQKATSAPATGMLTFTFSVYAAAQGGTALWTETHMVTLEDGYFSVQLGSRSPFAATLWDGSVRFLGMKVGADEEMVPREEVTSIPYALLANDVNGDIHPRSVIVGGKEVIDSTGRWKGDPSGLAGAKGDTGAKGDMGDMGIQGPKGDPGSAGVPCMGCVNTMSIAPAAVTSDKIASVEAQKVTGVVAEALKASQASGALETRLAALEAATRAKSAFQAYAVSDQSVQPMDSNTRIAYDTEAFDPNSEFNPTTGAFVPKTDGIYVAACSVTLTAPIPAGVVSHLIMKVGGPGTFNYVATSRSTAGGDRLQVTTVASLSKDVELSCFLHHEAAAPVMISGYQRTTTFSAARLY